MVATWLLITLSAVAPGPDTVVVSPPQFLDALRPWVAHRAAQGHRFAFITELGTAAQIRGAIRQQARLGSLQYVVLVGDAEPAARIDPLVYARCVPAPMRKAVVDVRWGSSATLPADSWYADLDDDDIPDLAIGRLPADDPQDLARLVTRIINYETRVAPGLWTTRIALVAGLGNFGRLIDPILEIATRHFLSEGVPPAFDTRMTYGSWQSPYCPSPYSFRTATLNGFNEGSLFWIYIGHGYPYQLDRVRVPGRSFPIFNTSDVPKLAAQQHPPIAILLACYTGAFDQPMDCLAEQMLRAPGGPIAVFAGARVTMPYGMAVLGDGLLDAYFQQRVPTLGLAILHAKRRMLDPVPRGHNRKLLDLMAATLSPNADKLLEERAEHAALFNLLGDPLLKLYYPDDIELDVGSRATAGSVVQVRAQLPFPGRCLVQLVAPRGEVRGELVQPDSFTDSANVQAAKNRAYLFANDRVWSARDVVVNTRSLLTTVPIPKAARGTCYVVVNLEDLSGRRYGVGARPISIRASSARESLVGDKSKATKSPAGVATRLSDQR